MCPRTLVDRKRKRLLNAIDVVEHLLESTDIVPNVWHLRVLHMFSSMTSLELLIQQSVEGEFRQHDGVMTGMMMLPEHDLPKHRYNMTEVDYGGGGHRTRLRDQ